MVRVVVPPAGNDGGENVLDAPIAWTFSCAEAGELFVRPCWVTRALAGIVLRYDPCVLDVTLTRIVQAEIGVIVALLSVIEVPPLAALNEAVAPQPVKLEETGFARKTLAGRVSVSDTPVRVMVCALLRITMDSWLISPAHIVLELKLLFMVGGRTPTTFKVALAGDVLVMGSPSPVEVNAPAGSVLIRFPGVFDVTSIATVQDPGVIPDRAGTVPPVNDRVVPPATAVTLPPQLLLKFTGLAIKRPGWTPTKLSVQAALVNGKSLGL